MAKVVAQWLYNKEEEDYTHAFIVRVPSIIMAGPVLEAGLTLRN